MLPLSENAQRALLRLARSALEEEIGGKPAEPPVPAMEEIERGGGVFVSLRKGGALRGCVGRPETAEPLFRTVRECALCAALRDHRFEPVKAEEIPLLSIEISVLSPLSPARAEDIEIGRHGLLISGGGRQGLLLPQVPVTWHWDRTRFLEETCIKAGLPLDAWNTGAAIYTFTTLVFGEDAETGTSRHGSAADTQMRAGEGGG